MSTESASVELLSAALHTLRCLRSSFTQCVKNVAEGPKTDPSFEDAEHLDADFTAQIKKTLTQVKSQLRDLESQVGGMNATTISLGNTGLLALDPSADKLPLYHQLLDCYTWTDKVHSYAALVHGILQPNNLKRSQVQSCQSTKRRRQVQNTHNVPQQQVDTVIQNIGQMFPKLSLTVCRPFGSNAVVQVAAIDTVTLGQVLRSVVTFKGLLIEWVVVRAYNEPVTDDNGKVDLYTSSQYKVFQRVTDNANAAMLNFTSPGYMDLSVRSFFTWLHSFESLFKDPCKKCSNHLHQHMPPTWRDFRTLEPFHDECRP